MPENQQNQKNKQKYQDEKGRVYIIERLACCASIGRVAQNVHILYEDGQKAVIPFEAHSSHSKLEDDAQSPAKCTDRPKTLIEIEAERKEHEQKHPYRKDNGYVNPHKRD